MPTYIVTIGLETHVQVSSKTKLFCSCRNVFGAQPNSLVCPICLGMPGVLPHLNYEVVKKAIKAGILLNCQINTVSFFDRKNYFYPDIPKSYQITQYHKPIAQDGYVELSDGKKIRIKRLHIEEDVGKLLHPELGKTKDRENDLTDSVNMLGVIRANYSFIDMNRSGIPLFEIVTEPDIQNADQSYEYLLNLKRKLQFEGISNCDMEKGQLRCDVNISVRKNDTDCAGDRVEIKNLNSFKFVKEAINFEINRQIKLLEQGQKIVRETRLWDPYKKITYLLRSKESVEDYRYFFEPDLPPLVIEEEEISQIRDQISESPMDLLIRYVKEGHISKKDSEILLSDEEMCLFYLEVAQKSKNPKVSFNWVANELKGLANELKVSVWDLGVSVYDMVSFIEQITKGIIDKNYAKEILRIAVREKKNLIKLLQDKKAAVGTANAAVRHFDTAGGPSDSDGVKVDLGQIVDEVLKENQTLVNEYLKGKESIKNVFIGKVLSKVKGIFTPAQVTEELNKKLKNNIN